MRNKEMNWFDPEEIAELAELAEAVALSELAAEESLLAERYARKTCY